jgi:hypothetical protein
MQKVFGIELDGTTTVMTIGRTQIPVMSGSYGDNLSPEKLRQMGSQIIDALTMGTYETDEGKVKMSASNFRGLFFPLVDQYGFGNRSIPLIFSFTHPEIGNDSDYLDGCRFTKLSQALEASNKAQEVEFGITVRQIYWTDRRITINALDTSIPLGPSML